MFLSVIEILQEEPYCCDVGRLVVSTYDIKELEVWFLSGETVCFEVIISESDGHIYRT